MRPIELIARREALGLTQTQCAKILGNTQSAVSHWEKGRSYIPDGVDDDLLALERLVDELVERMIEQATDAKARGEIPIIRLKVGRRDLGPVNEHETPPAILQRVAAARAQFELRDQSIQAHILETTD